MRKSIGLLLALMLLTSCGHMARKDSSPSPQDNPSALSERDARVNPLSQEGGAAPGSAGGSLPPESNGADNRSEESQMSTGDELELKDHLERLARRVPGVEDAHCVVMGDTAIVGLDVDGSLSRSRVGTVKYAVAEALRQDARGANALVTADMDLSHRIAELGRHFRAGRPIEGFATEMADIIGRIIPQAPEDTHPAEPPASAGPSANPAAPGSGAGR
ncbi:YhcN/YlaJ family sporulation lipoprotein [Paenibacillus glufosinatiresistens]|uniref:YhcN/YlaJ family sporulation lipoprotein n=1 Tax=Paenibacillus glufosinatiresistens TaxID=3070657 RepID=UPI00286EA87D|nr:YhcN/YlaJ family sporulation lipoprotein [Paenibacillus sp. YX.27]